MPSHPFSLKSIYYYYYYYYYPSICTQVFQVVSSPQVLHQNPTSILLLAIHATCPTHPTPLHLITQIMFREQQQSTGLSLCNFLQCSDASFLLGPNIFLRALFSNTLSQWFTDNLRSQVSHPYKSTGKIIKLYILILIKYV